MAILVFSRRPEVSVIPPHSVEWEFLVGINLRRLRPWQLSTTQTVCIVTFYPPTGDKELITIACSLVLDLEPSACSLTIP